MRTISTPLLLHLQGDVRTLATLWLITRQDAQVFGFTDHDTDIEFGGMTYLAAGYTASAIDMTSDLSTGNMEVDAILNNGVIEQADIEAGLWNYAAVSISLCNYMDLTMGALVVTSGVTGEFDLYNGQFKAELRGLAQIMQQPAGNVYSSTCRATFGDSQCLIDLTPLTFSGSVGTVTNLRSWSDPTLTQVGPTVQYTDSVGQKTPSTSPYTITVVPPTGGAWVSNDSVQDGQGNVYEEVGGSPGDNQYSVVAGVYTFDGAENANTEVFINYNYAIGYFAYGLVSFTSGQNKGYSMEVKTFAPGVVTLALQLPFPLAAGDTYTIIAGCDKQFGTCRDRFNNIIHFRGEPYIPGIDTIIRPQQS
jgi:hypothetical protein